MSRDDTTVIEAHVVRVTKQAVLLAYQDEQEWIPLSLVGDADDLEPDETMDVSIATWKLAQLGWD